MPEHATKDELNLKFDEILKKYQKKVELRNELHFYDNSSM